MTTLRVLEIFDSLQGEGYWTGTPMTFVRLAGCNAPESGLGCVAWCDTPDSWDRAAGKELEVTELVSRVLLPRMCLTGGEPLLQTDALGELVIRAHSRGIRVHVETNGTIGPPSRMDCRYDWVAISPKPPDYAIVPEWFGFVDELKLVVDEHLEETTAGRLAAACPEAVVFLQPEAGKDGVTGLCEEGTGRYRESYRRAIALVMEHPDWRLSLQVHKLLGIP
jgi:7-carboxy-7-deazaguanine synthase